MQSGRVETPVVVAALISVLLWSSAFVAIRYAGHGLGPGPLALLRLAVGSVALGVAMLVRREPLPRGRALWLAVLAGLVWFGVYNVALNAAERRIDAGTSSLLVNTGPLFLAVMAGVLLREGFPRRLFAGSLVSFSGVLLIGIGVSRHGLQASWGAALCVVAAIVYAAGVVAQKPALRSTSALAITWVGCTVGAVACLPWAPSLIHEAAHARASDLGWTVYLGLGPTAIGFGAWSFALARSSAGRLGATTYLVPPLAVLEGWVLLGETPPLLALPGGLLCLIGVWFARSRGARATPASGAAGGTVPPPAAATVAAVATSVPPRP